MDMHFTPTGAPGAAGDILLFMAGRGNNKKRFVTCTSR
ncbi:hypothetical protein J2T02_004839 [Chitinophaga terrae (ex Kim and Jung 2007)]|jgi:hypothetical protein|nr:hypothetical protein [Chitinophaga terrae (ex Kim and Jung 2007)]